MSATVVTRIARRMADAGLRRVVPSDLYPLVLGFLRDNQLSEVANKFAKATGAVSPGLGARAGWDDHGAPGPAMLRLPGRSVGSASSVCGACAQLAAVTGESLEPTRSD